MFKKIASAGLATAFTVGFALSASAATLTVVDSSEQGAGNMADVFASEFAGGVPAGSSWSSANPRITPPPSLAPGVYKSPFQNTVLADSQTFFSVNEGEEAVLTFADPVDVFRVLWGSVDSYNTLTLTDAGGDTAFTGDDIAAALGLDTTGGAVRRYEQVALLEFSGFDGGLSEATFSSDGTAFEFALAPIPLPAAGWMLLAGVAGLAGVARRRQK